MKMIVSFTAFLALNSNNQINKLSFFLINLVRTEFNYV